MGGDQHIHLTMHPARPSLADAIRISDGLKYPVGAKFDEGQAHRRAMAPEAGRGLVSIVGASGLFYSNAVGALGVVSEGRNWGLLAIASHRRPLGLVDKNDFAALLFPYGDMALSESGIADESFS